MEHCVKKKEKVGYVQPRVAEGRGGAARAAESHAWIVKPRAA